MTQRVEIHIHGSMSILKGAYPSSLVHLATSYPVQGAHFAPSYKRGLWDGRKRLFNKRYGSFPSGLIGAVTTALHNAGYEVDEIDHRQDLPTPKGSGTFDLIGVKMEGKYNYQLDACKKMVQKQRGIVKVATGGGKTELACAVTKYFGLNTLFIVTTKELLYQARKRFQLRLGLNDQEVGIVGDGVFSPGSFITIATVGTLDSRSNTEECQNLLQQTEVLFLDECHHVGSKTLYDASISCPATMRYGLSGTPLDRTDGANMMLIAVTGEVIVEITNKELVERGVSAKANIIFDRITEPVLKKNLPYPTVYKQGVSENKELLAKVVQWTQAFRKNNLGVLILVEEIKQGKLIDDLLWTATDGVFIPHQFIHGTESTEVRQKAISDFGSGSLPVLIASTIVDEGVDVPTIDALILAGSRKSKIRTLQRLGRGLRGKKLIVVEFANFCHRYLLEHSMQRLDDYKAEDCFGIHQSSPNEDLVGRIWNEHD